jgi:hypothetical protein
MGALFVISAGVLSIAVLQLRVLSPVVRIFGTLRIRARQGFIPKPGILHTVRSAINLSKILKANKFWFRSNISYARATYSIYEFVPRSIPNSVLWASQLSGLKHVSSHTKLASGQTRHNYQQRSSMCSHARNRFWYRRKVNLDNI